MKSSKTILASVIMIAAVAIMFIGGCKKETNTPTHCTNGIKDNEESGVDCGGSCGDCNAGKWRVKVRTLGFADTATFIYDNLGRIERVSHTFLCFKADTYFYTVDSIVVRGSEPGVYRLNSSGFAISYFQKATLNTAEKKLAFTYDAEGHLLSEEDINSGTTKNYIWSEGNRISVNTNGTLNETDTYFADTVSTLCNQNFGLSFLGTSSKNLLKAQYFVTSSNTYNYSYTFDALNRVIGKNEGTTPFTYTYY